jgi:hypothetical protein
MSHRLVDNGMLIALLGFCATGVLAGEIYKTVDANGTVTYSDHADPAAAQSSVVEWQDPRYPPHEMHVCWTNCFTLIYDGRQYRRADGTDETWTVTKFSAESFILHRHSVPAKWNGFSDDVTYAGRVSNDRLVGVTLNGTPTGGIDASWGIALNTLPGSNAERDARPASGSGNLGQDASSPPAPWSDSAADPAVSADVAPPPLPDDPQPVAPQDGYLWTPGHWYWRGAAYVWVPGAWIQPPTVGLLWTPGYWSFFDARYVFHPGYWGSHVGFYGGINYGYGYFGSGYAGGHWAGNSFYYNSSVTHLDPGVIGNIYAESVPNRAANRTVSFNGGPGGTTAVATEQEKLAVIEAHAAVALPRARVDVPVASWPTPVRSASNPAGRANFGSPRPVVVRESAPVTARTEARADSRDSAARSVTPRSTSVPAPGVNRSVATKLPPRP